MSSVVPFLPYVAALSAAAAVYLGGVWVLRRTRLRSAEDRLSRFTGPQAMQEPSPGARPGPSPGARPGPSPGARPGGETEVGSEAHRLQMAFSRFGLDVGGWETPAVWAARVILGVFLTLAIWLMGFPPLTLVAGPVIGWIAVQSLVDGSSSRLRRGVEAEIPTFLSRMSATVQANPNVLNALEEVATTLDPEGPLHAWVHRFAARLQAGGRPAFDAMLEEAEIISPSLGLAAFEVGRLWETGGEGYARAFAVAAENLSGILDSRAQAEAKAAGAKGAIRVVLAALILVTAVMLRNPALGSAILSPVVQAGYLMIAVWVAFGWYQVNSMIEEAVH